MAILKIGLLYLSLYNQLIKKMRADKTISRKEFFCIIGKHFLVPKNLRPIIIKEMENRNLIIQEPNSDITVIKHNLDLEKDANKLYRMAGLF